MSLKRHIIDLSSSKALQLHDISDAVKSFAAAAGVRDGMVIVASQHTTMGVVVNEKCEHLEKDMIDFLQKLAPAGGEYRHNLHAVDGRPNAHSHLLSLVIPSSVNVVIADGVLQLGTWQSLFAVELDGPRPSRKIHLTLFPA